MTILADLIAWDSFPLVAEHFMITWAGKFRSWVTNVKVAVNRVLALCREFKIRLSRVVELNEPLTELIRLRHGDDDRALVNVLNCAQGAALADTVSVVNRCSLLGKLDGSLCSALNLGRCIVCIAVSGVSDCTVNVWKVIAHAPLVFPLLVVMTAVLELVWVGALAILTGWQAVGS